MSDKQTKKTILVIDDDRDFRAIACLYLEEAGYLALEAETGVQGIAMARRFRPALILCDVQMPSTDGYSVLQALIQEKATSSIPFIFLTSLQSRRDVRVGMSLGADDYLTKPLDRNELLEAVSVRLERVSGYVRNYEQALERSEHLFAALASRDELTGLANRRALKYELDILAQRSLPAGLALLLIDLDRFRYTNEVFGVEEGWRLIRNTAACLEKMETEQCRLFHLGGDTFAYLCRGQEQIEQWASEILQRIKAEVKHKTRVGYLTASIGGSCIDENTSSTQALFTHAESALAFAKEQGRNQVCFYRRGLQKQALESLSLLGQLEKALEDEQFVLFYQPQIDIRDETLIGIEALIRWQHPKFGLLSPGQFIALAERSGLIVPMGLWVLEEACRQNLAWQQQGWCPVPISINVSPLQLLQADFSQQVEECLRRTGLAPHLLELEITESVMLRENDGAIETVNALRALGLQISIDDFGTGYASLSVLQCLPLHKLKLDRSFIREIDQDNNDLVIAKSILQMAESMKIRVVAEGVEELAQLKILEQERCYYIQGFLFSQPIPADEFWQRFLVGKSLPDWRLPERRGALGRS